MRVLVRFLLFWLCMQGVSAAELFATVDALEGQAVVLDAAGKSSPVVRGQKIMEGDTLQTRQDGELHLVTADGAFLALRPNTVFRVDAYRANQTDDDKMHISLLKGALRAITGWIGKGRRDAFQLQTPTATIGVRGTDHETWVQEEVGGGLEAGTYHRVTEGATVMRSEQHEQAFKAGEAGFLSQRLGDRPRLLERLPAVLAERVLRLESRVQERREALRRVIEQMPETRGERLRELLRDAPEPRERVRERVMRRAAERRN